jgi:hypothetical protein
MWQSREISSYTGEPGLVIAWSTDTQQINILVRT